MKKNVLGKTAKFAILFAFFSVMGMEAGEADIYCPAVADIKEESKNPYIYQGHTTDDPIEIKSKSFDKEKNLKKYVFFGIIPGSDVNSFSCMYTTREKAGIGEHFGLEGRHPGGCHIVFKKTRLPLIEDTYLRCEVQTPQR